MLGGWMLLAALGGATLAGPQASEKCRISNVFADHMVLQRAPQAAVVAGFAPQGTVITTTVVWGTARPPPHLPRLPTPSLDQPTSADHTHTHRHTPSPLAPLPPGMPHRYAPPPLTLRPPFTHRHTPSTISHLPRHAGSPPLGSIIVWRGCCGVALRGGQRGKGMGCPLD